MIIDDRINSLDRFRSDYLTINAIPVTDEYLRETVAMKPNGAEPADRRAVRADGIFDLNKLSQEAILPEFCPEPKLPALKKAIRNAIQSGIERFRITSVYGFDLFTEDEKKDLFLIASAPLPVCNSAAIQELADAGCSRVMAHLEMSRDDILDLRKKSILEVECFRLGRPSLLTSRAKIPFSGEFSDSRGNRFELRFEKSSGLSRIFPVTVTSIPHLPGIHDFYDLRNANWKNSDTETFNFDAQWL
jgi:putative protease